MKKILLTLPIALTCLLSACHDSNPLLTQPIKSTAKIVYNAEIKAMQDSHVYDAMGNVYLNCLSNPGHYDEPFGQSGNKRCESFFNALLKELQKQPKFNNLSLSNLKDPKVGKRLSKPMINLFQTEGQSES